MVQTLSSAIAWWGVDRPDAVALCLGGEKLTYRDYWRWSDRVAARLIADGLEIGDRVAICSPNSLAYCALIMGVIRAGGIVVPLNVRYTARELGEILVDTTARFVFADEERRAVVSGQDAVVRSMDEVLALRTGEPAVVERDLHPDLPVVMISTSGSTAKPKGVMFSHRSMTAYVADFLLEEPTCSTAARAIVPAPLSTSAGFVLLIQYTTLGCTLFLEPVFDAQHFLDLLQRETINAFAGAPVFFERIAACPGFAAADLSNLRLATTGGARVSRALQDAWLAKGVVLRQIYGQTECGGNATIMPAELASKYPEKCGRGGIFNEVAIIDADGARCPPGQQGQIILRGPGMMIGYWNNPEATAAAIKDGWLHTGDIGVMDEDGMLTFVDRMKDIIISGGLNISAAEVERIISEFDGVEEVVVIAAKDPKFGETPMAVLYGAAEISVAALMRHCNARLADYKVPRYVAVEDEPLPRLATGKLSKPAVRLKYADASERLEKVR